MAETRKRAGKRRTTAGPDGLRVRKSGVSKSHKPGLRKPKSTKTDPRKQKPSLHPETTRLKRQLKAARMQQEASAEILRAVANTSGDAAGPLQLIAETTARLFKASSVSIQLAEGSEFTQEYRVGAIAKRVGSAYPRSNIKVGGRNLPGTVVAESRQIHIPDLDHLDPSMSDFPGLPHARAGGARTVCGTPLRRGNRAIGALIVFRDRLLPFTGDELALLQSFADQAVIAIQNARLFNETQEALERQTATSEILRIISQSPTDVQPVFDAIVQTAVRLIRCDIAFVFRCDGATFSPAAAAGPDGPLADLGPPHLPIDPGANFPSRAIVGKKNVHLPDWSLIDLPEHERQIQALIGVNSALFLPLLREAECIGVLGLAGKQANIFGESEIALAESFRDQALIAIENTRLFNETREALERQTATADILNVIASSPTDTQPVFDAIARSAAELCEATNSGVFRLRDGLVHFAGHHNLSPEQLAFAPKAFPAPPHRGYMAGRAIVDRAVAHVPDIAADPEYSAESMVKAGFRSALSVPMLRNGEPIGAINVTREEARPFSVRQIELLKTFADQAVIAIENTRLFNETQEALERQTATADILRIISRSVAHAAPVFDTILESCQRLFDPYDAAVYLVEGDRVRGVARRGPGVGDWGADTMPLEGSSTGVAIAQRRPVHFPDLADKADLPEDKRAVVKEAGGMTVLYAPIISESRGVGSLVVTRRPKKPFTETEIEFIQSFADQAAIAIENARLFNEVEARTRDLGAALEQQTATADVLKVISRSAFDLDAVMHTLARSAAELCAAGLCGLYIREGDSLVCRGYTAAISKEQEEFVRQARIPALDPNFATTRVLSSGEIANIGDFGNDRSVATQAFREKLGFKSILIVPLMREGQGIGLFILGRDRVGQFSPRHVELVQTFADQAVIAIENARLFDEVQAKTRDLGEALEQQTATSAVLAVISRSPSDLNPVLEAISDTAARLCGSEQTMFFRYDGSVFRILASWNFPPEVHEMLERRPLMPGHPSAIGRAGASLKPVCIPDVLADPAYGLTGEQSRARYRATLAVPLLREGQLVGALSLNRSEPGAFTEKQIELVTTFADQAVIAIENTRLFNETKEALAYQTGSSNVLRVIASSPTDVDPVLKEIVESARELCEANDAVVLLKDEEHLRFSAHSGPIPVTLDKWPISRNWTAGRAFVDQKPVHVHDMLSGEGAEFPDARAMGQSTGAIIHTVLSVPLLRGSESIGAILLRRTEVRPFNEKQINLLSTFADQAVIAIQNARMFNETREALERQTATAEILKVIASSPDDVQPVFQAIAERSNHLVGGFATTVVSIVDEVVHLSAFTRTTPAADAALRAFYPRPLSGFTYSDAVRRGEIHRIVDAEVELAGQTDELAIVRRRGWRSALWVPLVLEGEAIGVIGVTRVDPGPFADHHVEMLKTFADQAVIAISNVGLFEQVQQRTRDLTESLQQQTATADVLKVISRSAFDLATVMNTLARSASELCEADGGALFLREDVQLVLRGRSEMDEELTDSLRNTPVQIDSETHMGRAVLNGTVANIGDFENDPNTRLRTFQKAVGFKSFLAVPLMREGRGVGVFTLTRSRVGTFSQRQIDLVQTFADQAVIAIENVRLFDEVQARTRELAQSLDDLRTAQDRLVQTEKLASLGQLTAGIAHEIKNPLNFVNNFSALSVELIDEMTEIFENPTLDEAGRRKELDEIRELLKSNLEKVVQHGKRADSIVKNMLLHSRDGSGEQRTVDINALLDESLNLAYHGARAEKPEFNITLQRDLDPDAGVIELFPQEITRALLNLISNGFYAASKRRADNGDANFEPVLSAVTKNLGDHIEIRIRDNGTGIPPEVKEKMFNPFFTTKPAGEGTGLGLSMSHDIIVKQHGGRIEVDTQPGQFTEFTIVLPRAANLASTGKN